MIRSAITGAPAFVGFEQQQMIWMGIGLIAMFIVASIDYRILTSAHWFIYVGLIALLIVVTLIGTAGNEANRWINLGFFNFQPSELGRVLIPVTLGAFVAARQNRVNSFSNTFITLFYMGVPILFIFTQPDLGMSILYIWSSGLASWSLPACHCRILSPSVSWDLPLSSLSIPTFADYQQARITSFLDPESDLEQSRNITALVAIGSGGWWGKGYFNGNTESARFLARAAHRLHFLGRHRRNGVFFGALIVLGLMAFILLRILRVASITPDPAGRYICVGIATMLFFQTLVSVGMNTRLLPVTGLTLPFVSYGGSALVTLYIAIGLVQSVLMRHRKQEFG